MLNWLKRLWKRLTRQKPAASSTPGKPETQTTEKTDENTQKQAS